MMISIDMVLLCLLWPRVYQVTAELAVRADYQMTVLSCQKLCKMFVNILLLYTTSDSFGRFFMLFVLLSDFSCLKPNRPYRDIPVIIIDRASRKKFPITQPHDCRYHNDCTQVDYGNVRSYLSRSLYPKRVA